MLRLFKILYLCELLFVLIGYENKDWFIPSPVLKPEEVEEALGLTPEQIRQTLNYFRE